MHFQAVDYIKKQLLKLRIIKYRGSTSLNKERKIKMAKKKIEENIEMEEIVEKKTKSKKKKDDVESKLNEIGNNGFDDIENDNVSSNMISEENEEVILPIVEHCVNCGQEFIVFPSEQKFYKSKGYEMPKRCPICRAEKNSVTQIKCIDCNKIFSIDGKEAEYYKKNNLNIPKRCKQCREFKRIRNTSK